MRIRKMVVWMVLAVAAAMAGDILQSPYGIDSYVVYEGIFPPAKLDLAYTRMNEAGMQWTRVDFLWKLIQDDEYGENGGWHYESIDRAVAEGRKKNIGFLPILCYERPWASPAWKHLDKWGEYVRRTVSRYAKDCRMWEVYNEENVSNAFWTGEATGENYTILLKRTYEIIKSIDPKLIVVFGGTSEIDVKFIEDAINAGAAQYCDVIAVHPYYWPGLPEVSLEQYQKLKEMLKKHHLEDKPLWVTESGWSDAEWQTLYQDSFPAALRECGFNICETPATYIDDDDYAYHFQGNFDPEVHLAQFSKTQKITLAEIKGLDVKEHPVLFPTWDGTFPATFLPDLKEYLRRGGTLIVPAGVPFTFDETPNGHGELQRVGVGAKYLKDFHIGFTSPWTTPAAPWEDWQRPAPAFQHDFRIRQHDARGQVLANGTYFTEENLQPGDRLIPLIEAGTDKWKGVMAGIYKFNSEDLKGNLIVYSCRIPDQAVTRQQQAQIVPRAFIEAFASGMDKYCWFDMQYVERSKEDRAELYGIVHQSGMVPKPAYIAYQTLTRMLPDGSKRPTLTVNARGIYLAHWVQPNGANGWAIWTRQSRRPCKLTITGQIQKACNHLGEGQSVANGPYVADGSVLYLIGPTEVKID